MTLTDRPTRGVDPVRLEVVKNALLSTTEEMSAALQRAAYSTNIKTRADFSCALFDRSLRVVAQAFAQPTHLGSLPHLVPRAVREYGPENLGPGDGILMNDPYRGAVHLNDITLISPVYHGDALFGYVANIAHHVDVGGGAPGSMAAGSEVYQEGIIVPPIKFLEGGQINPDFLRLILANVRATNENAGDFRAQVAANNLGIRRVHELIDRFGAETLTRYMDELLEYTERRTRASMASFPQGVFAAEDYLDGDGFSDEPIRIGVKVVVEDGQVTFDLAGCDPQRRGPANATYSMTFSGVAYVFKTLVDPDIPINDGFYRCLRVVSPPGTVVNANHPAPVAGGWEVCFRVTEPLFRAWAQALPERVVAGTKGIICNVAFGGRDPRRGDLYAFYETIAGGYGARPSKDGMDAVQTHVHNTENSPVEETELHYPVRITRYSLIPDSEGAGRFRGGLGVRRDYRFPGHEATFSVLSDRARFAPWGLFGGLSARPAHYVLDPEGEGRELGSKTTVRLPAGGSVSVQTPGGGGYGPPFERDPLLVLRDVRAGKVSLERARTVYGVAIDPETWSVDEGETARLRGGEKGKR